MIFLDRLYQSHILPWASQFNHLPLIKLCVESLDKTLLYSLIYLIIRSLYLLIKHRKINAWLEAKRFMLFFYLSLLISLTVLRHIVYPWDLHFYWQRPLSQINLVVLTETLKLRLGATKLDFFYNSLGNIAWFIPFGFLRMSLHHQQKAAVFKTMMLGILLSLLIEAAQFVLGTGMADIDDLIFNTLGALIGILLYKIYLKAHQKIKRLLF